ncbi:DUF2634 domain-containing protein [Paenibacillus sp. MSJ-34]|uniref:DUF2634 domain-containing protein n=1 Tax=Paenibacillus sp. MSJ-34 TaxID=2841529 RepID=UPI001C106277|nr:DUF2634 domain-containing protein [Paenibacillus sp. MSJ-34]MBU5441202.1 DUF2634 domain-containing protein [Paenibacillus sp. MSJ-34]
MPNLFPTSDMNELEPVTEESANEVSFGRSWRFDFSVGDFVMTPTGKVAASNDTDAWVQWCNKAIRTPRYRHLIYSSDIGQEFDDLLGRGLSHAAFESEIQRIVTETLMVDPRTASVDNFSFYWEEDKCFFTCRITNVRDDSAEIAESVVI